MRDIFEQEFVLSCDSNGGYDIYLGAEPLIPLVVGDVLLMKTVQCHFLFIQDGEWVLILCLVQDGLLIKGNEIEWVIACDCSVPIRFMLHLVHHYLGALTYHH